MKFKALAKKVNSNDNNISKILRLFISKPVKPNKNNKELKSKHTSNNKISFFNEQV